jgi:hypothetical protein
MDRGALAGPLAQHFAPVLPSADGGITVWYVSSRAAQTALAAALAPGDTQALVEDAAPFGESSTAIVFDGHGCHDLLRMDGIAAPALEIRAGSRACAYAIGAAVGQGEVRTYRVDTVAKQLLRRDEATGITVPVLDNVLAMTLAFLEDGRLVRIGLRLAASSSDPLIPAFDISCDVRPANLQGL